MTAEEAVKIIKDSWREVKPGGCRILSDDCRCVLCCADYLCYEVVRLYQLLMKIEIQAKIYDGTPEIDELARLAKKRNEVTS